MAEEIREFIVKLQINVAVNKETADYPELADALDGVDLMSCMANGMSVDLDSFAGDVLEQIPGSTISIGDPIVHNVHDVTGEDMTPYLEPNYGVLPHIKVEVTPRKGHPYERDE